MSKRQKPETNQLFTSLAKDLNELVTNKPALHTACENFLTNVVDDLTLGIIFDYHRKYKTKAFDLDANNCSTGEQVNEEVLVQSNQKKATTDCVCPICDKSVGASRFAPHLEKCMGMGKSRASRNARRGVNSSNNSKEKDSGNSNYADFVSDDEDTDWNPRYKRKRKKDKNGKKKSKAPSKKGDAESTDQLNVDTQGDEDDFGNIQDLLRDHSNSSSPTESVSSSHSSSRKRDKSKSMKSTRKDRASPGPNSSAN